MIRTMTKWTQGESRPLEKVATTERDEEEQLGLANTFIAHDKELAPNDVNQFKIAQIKVRIIKKHRAWKIQASVLWEKKD